MNEYGVWLKDAASERLVYTGTMNDAYRYAAIEQEKDASLEGRWRIGLLPQFIVTLDTPEGSKVIGAFNDKETAILFGKEFLEENDGKIDAKEVNVRY